MRSRRCCGRRRERPAPRPSTCDVNRLRKSPEARGAALGFCLYTHIYSTAPATGRKHVHPLSRGCRVSRRSALDACSSRADARGADQRRAEPVYDGSEFLSVARGPHVGIDQHRRARYRRPIDLDRGSLRRQFVRRLLPVVMKFDAGKLVRSFGEGRFAFPHGIHVDAGESGRVDGVGESTESGSQLPSRGEP